MHLLRLRSQVSACLTGGAEQDTQLQANDFRPRAPSPSCAPGTGPGGRHTECTADANRQRGSIARTVHSASGQRGPPWIIAVRRPMGNTPSLSTRASAAGPEESARSGILKSSIAVREERVRPSPPRQRRSIRPPCLRAAVMDPLSRAAGGRSIAPRAHAGSGLPQASTTSPASATLR